MSINDLRIGVTVFSLVLFVCIWIWAWSLRNQVAFQRAARLPLEDGSESGASTGEQAP